MPDHRILDVRAALAARAFPTITMWNRLEGRPRTADFARAMRAEVRDALWMLSRQWQMGELRGEDAGSPIDARLRTRTTPFNKYRPRGGTAEPFSQAIPLETRVERKPVAFDAGGVDVALDIRLAAGRRWLQMIASVGSFRAAYVSAYGVVPAGSTAADAAIAAHPESLQLHHAVAGRAVDGVRLYRHLKGGGAASDGVSATPTEKASLDALGPEFVAWFEGIIDVPAQDDAWDPARLEYSFACASPGESGDRTLEAQEYAGGDLDWFALDAVTGTLGGAAGAPDPGLTRALVPVPVTFAGMPDTRTWAFEDRRANFGAVSPDTTDLAKLMLLEFTLIFSNDWFIVPITIDVGTVTDVLGLVVTDTFGDRYWIERAGRNDASASSFRLFELHRQGDSDAGLVMLPTVPKVQSSAPREEVVFVRDEMSNMVWAIERTITLPSGDTKAGSLAARETLEYLTRLVPPTPATPAPDAALRYEIMSTVPENWIPFVPVRVPGDPTAREIQLQRGGLPRTIGSTVTKVRPRTALVRHGLDGGPGTSPRPYLVHEEEIPRAGVVVRHTFERTRWFDGRVSVWQAATKRSGRGEGSSGLAFDRAVPQGKGA